MRTTLPFIFAAWIVMSTLSCAQVGKDSMSPAQLAPGVSQKLVLEANMGAPPPVGWKWRVQERTRPKGGDVTRHTDSALYYTLEETHELVRGDTVETFPRGQAVFVPAGLEHIHRMLPLGSALRTFEIYFAPGDGSRPSQGADVRPLYFSEKAMEVVPGVTYTIRVVEVTLLPGARRDLTPRELQINYVLEGVMTRRAGDQVLSVRAELRPETPDRRYALYGIQRERDANALVGGGSCTRTGVGFCSTSLTETRAGYSLLPREKGIFPIVEFVARSRLPAMFPFLRTSYGHTISAKQRLGAHLTSEATQVLGLHETEKEVGHERHPSKR